MEHACAMSIELQTTETAHSIIAFAKKHGVCRSTIYAQIGAGRVIARKNGGRTVIYDADNPQYRSSLPIVQPKSGVPA